MQKDIIAEKNINGGDVLTTFVWLIPEFNQTGTSMIAPPRPNVPPSSPAQNPETIEFHFFFYDIF